MHENVASQLKISEISWHSSDVMLFSEVFKASS